MVLIKLFLIINIIAFFYRKAFNIKTNVFSCGIFGFSAKPNLSKGDLRMALQKFKILGIYNETRGKDSCGVYINEEILKGMGPKKLFTDFIEHHSLKIVNTKNVLIMGHNRAASTGSKVTEDNQHPLEINHDMLITHNGTLKDTSEFCKKYNLEEKDFDVDTRMLGTALYYNNEKVLENYKGAAALAYTYKSKPGILYLFHGESKEYKTMKASEERPLFYLETKEGIYYSSLSCSLEAIKEVEEEIVYTLNCNCLVEIENGKFTGKQIAINREDINIIVPKQYGRAYGYHDSSDCHSPYISGRNIYPKHRFQSQLSLENSGYHLDPILSLNREALPKRVTFDKALSYIYYYKGRHYVHVPNGPDHVADGELYLSEKKGYVYPNIIKIEGAKEFYFYKGFLMKDEESYEKVLKLKLDLSSFLYNHLLDWAMCMSMYTMHPAYDTEKKGIAVYNWYKDGKKVTEAFTPKFSGRSYKITKGYLNNIVSSHKDEVCFYDTAIKSEAEWNMYLNGGLISIVDDVSPFTPDELPFSETETKKAVVVKTEFYDKVYNTFEEAKNEIGVLEMLTLESYARWFLTNDVAWSCPEADVTAYKEYLIKDSVANGIPIIELCPNLDAVKELKLIYDAIYLDFEKEIHKEKISERNVMTALEIKAEIEAKMDIEEDELEGDDLEAIEYMETILENFKELQEETNDCVSHQENEVVQALASHAYKAIDRFLDGLNTDPILRDKAEIKEFIKDIKIYSDGVV